VTPRPRPLGPARRPRPNNVGGGNDYSALPVSGTIFGAAGSFDSETGVTGENLNGDQNTPNTFSLQLNSQNSYQNGVLVGFPTAAEGCDKHPGCTGWQQFSFSTDQCTNRQGEVVPCVFLQYWLLNYGSRCPAGWKSGAPTSPNDCFMNAPNPAPVPSGAINANDLAKDQVALAGTATAGGEDTVTLFSGELPTENGDSFGQLLQSGAKLATAEFNIFGDCCLNQAVFTGIEPTLVVRLGVDNGTFDAPSYQQTGFTAETNNLSLWIQPCRIDGSAPAIVFTETWPGVA
jgi:hypothetical protein